MTTLETITTNTITGLLDEVAQSLGTVPGRTPQDAQIASALLSYVVASIHGTHSRLLLNTLERHGADTYETEAVALALRAMALRLGAWIGRER